MRKDNSKLNICSKKGVTLVELVVSMTLVAIFAVVCVSLINPIERIYQHTVKLSHAQLIADTIVDSIRKECDDVDNSEESSVWIAEKSGDDASSLINKVNPEDSGSILIMRRNGNYCEAIFSCLKITESDLNSVTDTPMTGSSYSHAASSLLADSDTHNRESGYVHFGYYQAKDNNNGVTPYKAYDYTNPLTASTYEGYTVTLKFKGLGYKTDSNGVKHPTFVRVDVNVYDGNYKDESKRIYTRSTVISFSPNGSGKGTHGGDTPSTTKDIDVRVRWVDEAGKPDQWPDSLLSIDIIFNGSSPARKYTLSKGYSRFVFSDVTVSGSPTLTCTNVPEYTYTYKGNVNSGYVVTYKHENVKTVKLICGEEFVKKIDQNNVTGVVFGKKSEWIPKMAEFRASGATVSGPTNVAIPYGAAYNSMATKDDYVLYKVSQNGRLTVYVLSKNGSFVLNDSCKKMFINCKKLESITGFTGPEPVSSVFSNELTTNMQSMFEGCVKITSFKLAGLVSLKVTNTAAMFYNCTGADTADLSDWNTSGVTTMENMFRNCEKLNMHSEKWNWNTSKVTNFSYMFSNCDTNPDSTYTIDISSFKFNQSQDITMTHMFEKSGVTTVKFPAASNSAKKVTNIEYMFNSCTNLTEIENFVIARDSADDLSGLSLIQYDFSGVTKANNLFANCTSLKNIGLSINLSKLNEIKDMFTNCTGLRNLRLCVDLSSVTYVKELIHNLPVLESADLSQSNFASLTKFDNFFHTCNGLKNVKMNDLVLSSFTGVSTTMFEDVYHLTHLEMQRADFSNVEDTRFITRDSLEYLDLSGAKFSNKTSCENMFKIISGEAGKVKQLQTIIMKDTELPKCTSYKNMFKNCHKLTTVNFKPVNSSPVDCTGMFSTCESLTSIDLSAWNKTKVTNISYMFQNCTGFTNFSFTDLTFETCTDASYLFSGCTSLSTVNMLGFTAPKLTTCEGMFQNCTGLTSCSLKQVALESLTNISKMFSGCTGLTTVDMSEAKLPSCESFNMLFANCKSLNSVDLRELRTPKLMTCESMFQNCYSLNIAEGNTSGWDTSSVTNVSNMFYNACYKGESGYENLPDAVIDISGLKFTNINNFSQMFWNLKDTYKPEKDVLKKIILPSGEDAVVNANEVTTYRMFNCREHLTEIQHLEDFCILGTMSDARSTFARTGLSVMNISKFDFDKITKNANWLFSDNKNLTKIIVNPACNYNAFSNRFSGVEMFAGCSTNLVGQAGTHWVNNKDHTMGKYARIDGEQNKEGYFSVA